jgi:hypothetical protein
VQGDRLPNGSTQGNGAVTWGPSWYVGILPFCEQKNLSDLIEARALINPDYNNATNAANTMGQAIHNQKIPWMLCPSSPLPQTETLATNVISTTPSYIGIAGAIAADGASGNVSRQVNAQDTPVFNETRRAGALTTYGEISSGGLLTLNECFNMAAAIDGTSNVMIVSECSDYFFGRATTTTPFRTRTDGSYRNNVGGRWYTGARTSVKLPTALNPAPANNNNWIHNITTVRSYPFPAGSPVCIGFNGKGQNVNIANNTTAVHGIGSFGLNRPLLSAHPNVVLAAFMDGHTQAITKTTHPVVVKRIATRDDGQNMGGDFGN